VRYLEERGFVVPPDLPRGAYVGEVTVTDCRPLAECDSPWAFGPWCFLLTDALAYETPIPGRGRLGFYPVPPAVPYPWIAGWDPLREGGRGDRS
jgi:hypothetical protein